ncbi:MerR family DNA-binding transcriptional regulator [Hyphomicrobium sp.]|uniref:MerR family transcriptional regulator n=1 Tax=Hyphomicrobium sp. TaxID=82 RepID=UPI002D77CE46|nr:MerR family DNA-binding transcriptional regulator [Hyphomicrobium sp.]HET6388244.1 MerR family DNA-binding transcriptional regulator [Hyphomicrobium sp.]
MSVKSTGSLSKVAGSGSDSPAEPAYTISALAKEFGVTTRAIRFYESRGLISPERVGTARRYSKRDRARLILILRGRNLGFSVEDVSDYLSLYDSDPAQLAQTRHLLDKVTAAIGDLETKRDDIARSLDELNEIRARCEAHLKKNA